MGEEVGKPTMIKAAVIREEKFQIPNCGSKMLRELEGKQERSSFDFLTESWSNR